MGSYYCMSLANLVGLDHRQRGPCRLFVERDGLRRLARKRSRRHSAPQRAKLRRLGTPTRRAGCLYAVPADWPNPARITMAVGHSVGFPSRRKCVCARASGPRPGALFVAARPSLLSNGRLRSGRDCCYPSAWAGHAFVMFIPRSWLISSRIIFVCEPVIPRHAGPAAGRRLEGSRG